MRRAVVASSLFALLCACQPAFRVPVSESLALDARLYRPDGPGPFPAVVLMHGCSGLTAVQESAARLLRDRGYVALVVDGFSARGVETTCGRAYASPTPRERVEDARAAVRQLETLPYVDPRRVALVGWSHGGLTALLAWAEGSRPPGAPFCAVAAFYPHCSVPDDGAAGRVPLLVLIGGADDWTPPSLCQTFAAGASARGRDVSLVVYPGATHSFDREGAATTYAGHLLVPDRGARRDARERLIGFLDGALAACSARTPPR
jgi:dienelactone hydrolase